MTWAAGTTSGSAAVANDGLINAFRRLVDARHVNPREVSPGGGSVTGSMDHLIPAMEDADENPARGRSIPCDANTQAMAPMATGENSPTSDGCYGNDACPRGTHHLRHHCRSVMRGESPVIASVTIWPDMRGRRVGGAHQEAGLSTVTIISWRFMNGTENGG